MNRSIDQVALYRADGSKQIGMGHLFRASFVAKQLLESFNIRTRIVCKENAASRRFVEQRKLEHIFIPEDFEIQQEINFLQEVIEEARPILFILDVLEEDQNTDYTSAIKNFQLTFVAITDDSLYRSIDADIVVNGNPNQVSLDYSNEKGKYLVGPRYFIMPPEYGTTEVQQPESVVRKVLITLGGSDHNDLIFRIIDAFNRIDRGLKLTIITSENTGYLPRLRSYMEDENELNYTLHVDVPNLIDYWKGNDIVISAGGNTLFERIASRIPGATVCQLARQMEIASAFEDLGVNSNIGFGPDLTDTELINGLKVFINDTENHLAQFKKAPDVVSGYGLDLLIKEVGLNLNQN